MHETSTGFFNLESPEAGVELSAGRQQIRGWLVPKPGHHFVNVRARLGAREFPGVYGFPRKDLAAHFEPTRAWLPAEFTIEVDFPPGDVEVTFEALSITGSWITFHRAHFAIRAGAKPASPAPDPITAVDFGRAIQVSLVSSDQKKSVGQPDTAAELLPYPRVTRSEHVPFRGYIAEPSGIAPALYGQTEVVGWLFHETQAIEQTFVTTDLLTFQPLETGGEFADVKARFPNYSNAGNCRIAGFVDISSQLPSPVCVRVYAELSDGSVHLCLAIHSRPQTTDALKQTCSPFSFFEFWKCWRAQKNTLAQLGLPLETGPALRREFWSTLRRCRQLAVPRMAAGLPASAAFSQLAPKPKPGLLLITHNLNFEGAPLLFVEYARHVVEKSGADVSVLTAQDGPLRKKFEALGISVTAVNCAANLPAELSRNIGEISRNLDWTKIDLVVANTLASFWGVQLARSARRPSLLYIHESTSPAAFFRRTTPALLPAVYDAFRQATAVSFNTPATQAYYSALGSGNNFHLNSAWIDLDALTAFRAAHARNDLRARLALRPDELLIANIGTVCERKGQHDFLRAIEWLWRRAPLLASRCRFVMVGGRDTRYNLSLKKNLAALNRPNIQLIPETSQAYDYFGAADLFVCTSYEESFPRVVLEAMAFGVPIVSTNVHGIPYMLRNESEAVIVPPGDIDALTSGMLRLLENPSEANGMAMRTSPRVAEFAALTVLPRHAAFTARVAARPA